MTSTMERSKTTQEVQGMPFAQLFEAIARGVEARLARTEVLKIVTIETMCIARKLHIPEEEIQEWRSSRCYRSESTEQTNCLFLQSMGERKQNFP
jgi:hypothetical protein